MLAALLLFASQPSNPIDFGRRALAAVAGSRLQNVEVRVQHGERESFSITPHGSKTLITAGDPVGAMYGQLELAERIENDGDSAWSETVNEKPFLAERGVNLFLTLPWDYKKNDTDDDPAALVDPNRWWFQNEDYWTTLLDIMAKSRLNWLDIHGAWDISVTDAPNLYAYFIQSQKFPEVGVASSIKTTCLEQLNHVIDMAHARGIKVSLMSYQAGFNTPQNRRPPYKETQQNLYSYTREVVEKMIRQAPGLDAIGFRIGESGKGESFFNCYLEAVKRSGRDIPLITRSWITKRQNVLRLARASKDFSVEIKYNGEHWGAPYQVAGGRVPNWYSYSFEDYLSDAGHPERNAHTWPGQPAEGGSRWPSEPYKIVWQVRANGTHRIFPFYNPQWVRRTIQAMPLGTTSGYTIEGIDAYFPKSPDYYLANPKDKYCNWIHQRDEMYWMTWGRLGYDPSTKDAVFDHRAAELLCTDSQRLIEATPLIEAWKKVSTLLSKNFMAYSLGPDHRNHAPELEWGGDTDAFIQGQGFDTHVFEPVNEEFANLVTDGIDGRFSLRDAAEGIWQETSGARALKVLSRIQGPESRPRLSILQLLGQRPGNSPRASDLDKAENVQIYWAMYMASRFLSAHELANIETIFGQEYRDEEIANDDAATFFTDVTQNGFYKPFTDRLRMHTNSFSWASQQRSLDEESQRLKLLPAKDAQSVLKNALYSPFSHRQRIHGNDYYSKFDIAANVLAKPTWADSALRDDYWDHTRKPVVTCQEDNQTVSCKVRGDYLDKAWLLVKPLPSSTYFHKLPMTKVEGGFELTIPRERCGMALAVEVVSGKDAAGRPNASRWPDAMLDRPYLVVPAQSGPTPEIYNASEAMTYFDPKVIKPENYGGLLLGTRAWAFFGSYDRATKRKLLEPVEKGMRLVILQQNFERYKLDWLPKPLAFESAQSNTFDPGGELGLEKVEAPGAMWQRFLPSDGWKVFGNGGLAMTRIGKGEVWVTSARLMQNMQYQSAAKAFVKLLSLGGKSKPTILVDSCSEDATYSSSCHADLMNSHDIPFMTMGEVVAKEQGMNSEKPIAGPKMDDDVLDGKGKELADKFLKNRVIALSHRATPPSLTAFEKERVRRKRELLKALGLDPMPKKTPLNARQTGVIQGNGFHIEKVVFESRPKFYVTAHVYVPDHKTVAKLPAIVNVNGHWAHKKDEDRVQLRCQLQALRGYIAIAIDTPGFSFEGNSLIERRAEGDHNDYKLVEGGSNTTGYYVWDAMRAVDYLQTRGDVDMNHIGLTGASGGGLATLYAFAADDRYKAAVPVVYMSSLELAPDNGCLCNHVPGTCQVGDRSDVIAIQAPKPVLLMGAENDGEFPPDAMRLTHKKMAESWDLFGKKNDVYVKIFAGGHDYNQPMRETMIGFFDKYLRGVGDGSPVPQPHLEALDPENHSILVLDPPLKERTMRDLSKEYLAAAPSKVPVAKVFEVNGGVPERTPLNYKETGEGSKKQVVFESEPGLFTPGILVLPSGTPRGVRIVASDAGKKAEAVAGDDGFATLYLDVLGTGELSGIEMRYAVYAGRAVSFTAGWQIVRAAEAMRRYSDHIEVFGEGPMCSQAAMYAGLMDNHFAHVTGTDCLKTWTDVFADNIPDIAVQPRAHLCGSLEELRSLVKNGEWRYR